MKFKRQKDKLLKLHSTASALLDRYKAVERTSLSEIQYGAEQKVHNFANLVRDHLQNLTKDRMLSDDEIKELELPQISLEAMPTLEK
jgi:hypothetical protein